MEDNTATDLRTIKRLLWVMLFIVSATGARLSYVAPVNWWDVLFDQAPAASISVCQR